LFATGLRPRSLRGSRLRDVASALGKQPVGVGRLQTPFDLLADEAELINLIAAVQSAPARASGRNDLPIAILPGPKRLHRQTQHPRHRPDAVNGGSAPWPAIRLHLGDCKLLPHVRRSNLPKA
jgi:hypothetical protein